MRRSIVRRPSTVKAGSELRDKIAALLRMKYSDVAVEVRIGSTTADVIYTDDTNNIFKRKIAIEAKNWKSGLSSKDLSDIYNLYNLALTNGQIDNLWIIGNHTLGSSPRASVDQMKGVVYSTYDEFISSLMNFTPILLDNQITFENHDSYSNFIKSRVRNSNVTIEEKVFEWISSDCKGMILFGGYGLGKTSFSMYLASELSRLYMSNDFNRIPIRISLGGLYTKQDLTSLICATLSASETGANVRDFSYNMFIQLNRNGHFVLILDGFDEMRHAMDIDDFVYTFEQMRPLFHGNTKVIILGRPDSFFSDEEEDRVLSSMFDGFAGDEGSIEKIEISFLNKNEVNRYLDTFLTSETSLDPAVKKRFSIIRDKFIEEEIDVLSRPVQLSMFTKVISEFVAKDTVFNRFRLFQSFVNRIVAREGAKQSRAANLERKGKAGYDDARSIFMQEVAWWLLNTKRENRFTPSELPLEIVPLELREKHGGDAALREALLGSVIEHAESGVLGKKGAKYYYFPHKSYIEYLVAIYFIREKFSIDKYRDFVKNINPEILSFIDEGPIEGKKNLREGLSYAVGPVDKRLVDICAADPALFEEIARTRVGGLHPADIYVHYVWYRNNKSSKETAEYLQMAYLNTKIVATQSAILNCVCDMLIYGGMNDIMKYIIVNSFTSMNIFSLKDYIERNILIRMYLVDHVSMKTALILKAVTFDCERGVLVVSVSDMYELAHRAAGNSLFMQFRDARRVGEVVLSLSELRSSMSHESATLLARLFERGGSFRIEHRLDGEAETRFGRN